MAYCFCSTLFFFLILGFFFIHNPALHLFLAVICFIANNLLTFIVLFISLEEKNRKKTDDRSKESVKKETQGIKLSLFLTIAFDRRPQTWLGGPGAPLMGFQASVTPLMGEHILCDLSVP